VGSVVLISALIILNIVDRKCFVAYSSIIHISLCVLVRLIVMLLVGYMHIVLSPLMFMTIYMIYNTSGSRFYMKSGVLMMCLFMVNFRLPFLRSFFSEVYLIQYYSLMLLILMVSYIVTGFVMMKSLNMDGKGIIYLPFMVLYLLIV